MTNPPPFHGSSGTGRWENEGGTLHACTGLPDGIVAVAITHYRVGPYTYTTLADAAAELGRWAGRR